MRRWWAAASVLVAITMLAGCSFAAGSAESGGASIPAPAVEGAVENGSGGSDPARQVISEGYLTITASDPANAAAEAVRLVERAGGRIDSRNEHPATDDTDGSAQLVARIPSARLTTTLDELKELGEVREVSITSTDVTSETRDLDARISALGASVDRLTGLLSAAETTKDLIEIESALSERQSNLESLQSQQRSMSERVDLATVSLNFESKADAPGEAPRNFLTAVAAGWTALIGFGGAALIAIGVVLPWVTVAALIAAVTVALLRRRASRASKPATTMEE